MRLPLILDENSRGRDLWGAIQAHNPREPDLTLDIVRVGGPGAPILGTLDRQLLEWAISENRILDVNTLVRYHSEMVQAGLMTPGLFVIRRGFGVSQIVDEMVIYSYCLTAAECSCNVWYLPGP